jgi:uncharacterized protein (TIGR02284 family)
MEIDTGTVDMLYDLLAIQNDRIRGYAKAYEEYKDPGVNIFFKKLLIESRYIRLELAEEIMAINGKISMEKTGQGWLYQHWIKRKVGFTGNNCEELLINCDEGEYATQQVYYHAIESVTLPGFVRNMLLQQQQMLKNCHEKYKDVWVEDKRRCA